MPRFLLLISIIAFCSQAIACDVSDDAGNTLHLARPAKRLIVLAPDLVENVFAVGAGAAIVGVVQGSDFPKAALQIPVVGSYSGVDLERIVSLHPDLIIGWKYAFPRQLAALQRLGIPVYIASPKQLNDVPALMRKLGCLTGQEQTANAAAAQFEASLQQIKKTVTSKHAPTVFFQIDQHLLMTINKDSWINQVIEMCGGKNLYANAKVITPEITREAMVLANPEVIMNISNNDQWKSDWQQWPNMTAVKNHALYSINPDIISRAGPRLVDGVRQVCRILQGSIWQAHEN